MLNDDEINIYINNDVKELTKKYLIIDLLYLIDPIRWDY